MGVGGAKSSAALIKNINLITLLAAKWWKKKVIIFCSTEGKVMWSGPGWLVEQIYVWIRCLFTYCETSSPHFLRSVMLPPCVIFIERINDEININVLKKKIWPKRREYFNDFKMADLNLFCFVFFFLVSFFSSFLHGMIVVKYWSVIITFTRHWVAFNPGLHGWAVVRILHFSYS